MPNRIEVVAVADPFARSTWSGTPMALASTFETLGVNVDGFTPMPSERRRDKVVSTSLTSLRYGTSARKFRQYVGPMNRVYQARMMKHAVEADADSIRLHTDILWLPEDGELPGRNFLFRDTSISQLAKGMGASKSMRKSLSRRYRQLPKLVDHAFVTSEWAKGGLLEQGFGPSQVTVVGTGIGFEPPVVSDEDVRKSCASQTILCVAKVRFANKGLDLLLDGFQIARESLPSLTLKIVAPPGIVAAQDGVQVLSNLPYDQLIQLYSEVSLFAMPARYEPWGLVYLEAMACGTPVLGSKLAAFPEICGHGSAGFIIDNLSARAVADAIVEAYTDDHRLETMSRNALATRNRFSWNQTGGKILKYLDTA